MFDISGFASVVRLTATSTFPNGFDVTEFADDADAIEITDLTVGDTGMGLNGDLLVWSRPAVIEFAVNVIPGSQADVNCGILLEANRVAKGKRSARDVISAVANYSTGEIVTLSKGKIITGTVIPGIQQTGRIRTKTYRVRFENVSKTGVDNKEI